MEGKVLTKEELENITREMDFSLVEIETDESSNKIEISNQQDFLDFHEHVENKLLFYYYDFEDKSDFTFPNDVPGEYNYKYPEPILNRIRAEINEYNKLIDETDFSTASGLMLFYIKDGFLFYNYTFNEDRDGLPDYDCLDYDRIAENIRQDFSTEELGEMDKKYRVEIEKQIQNLKETIYADPKFALASNQTKRKRYSKTFFENTPAYVDLLRAANYTHPIFFIDDIWGEFQAKKDDN
ncbi:hypothetical protein MOF05_21615 [Bacillus haynesii]|uniref:hypothetical protein n=1 Tax=Bacillus haynesii TaxID=1925021 RepID=UPI0022829250|nr:hypothetical protein [Bacillus haynesii]MCY9290950.1 hypothetical protein [Bacillus haynesii]